MSFPVSFRTTIPLILLILVLTALTLFSCPVFAEDMPDATTPPLEEAPRSLSFRFGALALINFSDISYSDRDLNEPFSKKLGFGGGLQTVVQFHSHFSVQPELLYVQRGMTSQIAQFPDDEEEVIAERRIYNYHYLQLPLLFRTHISLTDTIGLHAVAGPSMMFFLKRTARGIDGTVNNTDRDGLRVIHFGGAAGAGLEVDVNFGILSLDLRYDRSINSFTSDESIAHTAFSFLVGFSL